jgi:hypothetical protein
VECEQVFFQRPVLIARKMGESDMHAVMASGFAGGIGLCGGACGALGAAWISMGVLP